MKITEEYEGYSSLIAMNSRSYKEGERWGVGLGLVRPFRGFAPNRRAAQPPPTFL